MGKGRLFSDSSTDEVYNTQTQNETYVLGSQQNTQGLGSGVFNDSSGYGNFQQSGRDQRNAAIDGALFRGNLGFTLDTAVLDVTTSTLNLLEDATNDPLPRASIDKIVTLSTGSASDLITILGAQRTGQRLRLYNIDTNTITIKNTGAATTDTIFTPGGDDLVVIGNEVVDLTYDITTAKWRVVGGSGVPPPGISYPILYPKQDFVSAGITIEIDLSIETGNAKQILLEDDVGLAIGGDPADTVGEDVYVLFIQDGTGGHDIVEVDPRIKNGGLMDTLLDKAADAKTVFRLSTLDGGLSYHAVLIDLSTAGASGLLSTLAIDTDKDWAGRFITNLAGLDLFANAVANNITNMGVLTFISDLATTRGQFGRSDFFIGAPDGLVTNIPNTANNTWTIDGTEKFRLDGPNDKLISSIDLDMNTFDIFNIDQARFSLSSGIVSSVTDSVILLNSNDQFQFNTAETNDFVFSLQNIAAFAIDRDPAINDQVSVSVLSDSTEINSFPIFNISRTSTETVSAQDIGLLSFNAQDSADAGVVSYSAISSRIEDNTTTQVDGSLSLDVTINDSPTTFLSLNFANDGEVKVGADLDISTFNIIDIDQAKFVADSVLSAANAESVILLNTGNQFQFNTGEVNDFVFSIENIAALIVDRNPASNDEVSLTVQSDDTNTNSTANFNLTRTFEPSVSLQIIGQHGFRAPDDTNAGTLEYAAIVGKIEDASAGTIDGSLSFDITQAGAVNRFLTMNDSTDNNVKLFKDLNVNTFNLLNIDQAKFVADSVLSAANAESVILLNTGSQFQFNTSIANDFVFSFDNNAALVLDDTTGTTDVRTLTLQSDSDTVNSFPLFKISRTSTETVSTQDIGEFSFNAQDSADAGVVQYSAIRSRIEDNTTTQVDGSLSFDVTINDLPTTFLNLNFGNDNQVNILRDLDMNSNDILMGAGGNITAGGATEGMTNIGHLDFVDNTQTPAASLSIYSDGTDMLVNTGGGVVNLSDLGDVTGPLSSTDNAIARFDGTTGKIIQNSLITILDSGTMNFNNESISNLDALGFNDVGGQINVSAGVGGFNFVTTSDVPFRFTPNATNVLDIDDSGLTMITGNIELGNGNVTGVNQIAFNIANQTITDDVNGMRFSLPDATDTFDFTIDSNLNLSIEKFFINFFNSRLEMTQEVDPASPVAGDIFVYAKLDSGISKLFYKQSDGTVVGPLGGGGNSISQLDSNVTVTDTGTNGLISFTTDSTLLASWNDSVGFEILTNMDMNLNEIRFNDVNSKIEFDGVDNGMAITNQTGDQMNFKWQGGALEYDFNETEFDLHSNNINSVGPIIEFQSSGGAIIWPIGIDPNRTQITASTSNMRFKVGSAGDEFVFTQVTTDLLEINSVETRFINSDIELDTGQDIRWNAVPNTGFPAIREASGNMTFAVGSTNDIFMNFGSDVQFKYIPDGQTGSGNAFLVVAKQTNTLLSVIEAQQDRVSGGSSGQFAAFQGTAKNSSNTLTIFGAIEYFVNLNTAGSEDAEVGLPIRASGAFVDAFTADGQPSSSSTIPRIAFRGATPQIAQNYTLNTFNIDRNLSSNPTNNELRDVLGTLLTDLIAMGLIQ